MKKNKKNAFTLIELLAVIVILAIIALIATPIILGIVEDARKDSFIRSVELVVGTTDIDIFSKNFTDSYTYTITDGVVSDLEVGVKNTDGMNGKIKYDKNGNDTYAIHNGKYCVIKTKGMKKAEIIDYVEGECVLSKTTDESYFTYEEIEEYEYEYEIVDKNACIEWFENDGATNEQAISMCDNEPDPWDGMTLIEQLTSGVASKEVGDGLKEVGAIEEKVTLLFEGIEITGYSSEGPKDVVIPEEINGKEVVSIGDFAFSNMSLTSVVLPETLVKISHSAFSTNLFTDITLPSNVETIEDYAFCYTNLNQTSVNNITKINENAYCTVTDESCFTYEDAKLVEYEIVNKDACVDVFVNDRGYDEDEAISVCNNEPDPWNGMTFTEELSQGLVSPSHIEQLKYAGAIEEIITSLDGIEITGYKCAANDIVIPNKIDNKEVVAIGGSAFFAYDYNDNVETYINKGSIMPVNYDLASVDPDGTLTSIVIPDNVMYIKESAFAYNDISSIKLSANLLEIMYAAFEWNIFEKITIPNSVTYIGSQAFVVRFGQPLNVFLSNNNQLETIEDGAFDCLVENKAYEIIYNINPRALVCK